MTKEAGFGGRIVMLSIPKDYCRFKDQPVISWFDCFFKFNSKVSIAALQQVWTEKVMSRMIPDLSSNLLG
jgi:hypothetical protein